jgi:hypothetical protein
MELRRFFYNPHMRPLVFILLTSVLTFHSLSASDADVPCPLTFLSGSVTQHVVSVTFRNAGKKTIRELDLDCKAVDLDADKAHPGHCFEEGANFLPGHQYTTRYSFVGPKLGAVLMSVKGVTFGDGVKWKPSKDSGCKALKALPARK